MIKVTPHTSLVTPCGVVVVWLHEHTARTNLPELAAARRCTIVPASHKLISIQRLSMSRKTKIVHDTDWASAIEKVVAYAFSKNWKIDFVTNGPDQSRTDTKGQVWIQIDSTHSLEHQLYFFLHECGHAIEVIKLGKSAWNNKYSGQAKTSSNKLEHRISRLYEEMTAWDHAMAIAVELCLQIDHNSFNSLKTSSLSTYVTWTNEIIQ